MTKDLTSVDITRHSPAEVLRLLREVVASGRRVVLTEGETPLADVSPPKPVGKTRLRGRRTGPDDRLWNIVGMAGRNRVGPTDVAANKQKYLAEAYAPKRPQKEE